MRFCAFRCTKFFQTSGTHTHTQTKHHRQVQTQLHPIYFRTSSFSMSSHPCLWIQELVVPEWAKLCEQRAHIANLLAYTSNQNQKTQNNAKMPELQNRSSRKLSTCLRTNDLATQAQCVMATTFWLNAATTTCLIWTV